MVVVVCGYRQSVASVEVVVCGYRQSVASVVVVCGYRQSVASVVVVCGYANRDAKMARQTDGRSPTGLVRSCAAAPDNGQQIKSPAV
jgi:hypothetical protein